MHITAWLLVGLLALSGAAAADGVGFGAGPDGICVSGEAQGNFAEVCILQLPSVQVEGCQLSLIPISVGCST